MPFSSSGAVRRFAPGLLLPLVALAVLGLQPRTADAATVSRAAATKVVVKQLRLGAAKQRPVAVFTAMQPAKAGTVVTQAGAAAAAGGPAIRTVRPARVLQVKGEPAWLFYVDDAPYVQWEHPGRVVLVGTRSGKVRGVRSVRFAPLVNGALPPYLATTAGYTSPKFRVYYRAWRTNGARPKATFARPVPAPANLQSLATLLGSQGTCVLVAADSMGSLHKGSGARRAADAFESYFRGLAALDSRLVVARYAGGGFSAWVDRTVASAGCRKVTLYVAGGGYRAGEPAVNLGTQSRGGRLRLEDVRAADLRALLAAHPAVGFTVVADASYTGLLEDAVGAPANLQGFVGPAGRTGAFGYLPHRGSGPRMPNDANPAKLTEFTNQLLLGLDALAASDAETQNLLANAGVNNQVSAGSWLVGRGIVLGGLLGNVLGGAAPFPTTFFPVAPTAPGTALTNGAPTATPSSLTVAEDSTLPFTLAGTDPDGEALAFTVVTGPAHGTLSGSGASRTYVPAANYSGPDSLTFRVTDARGAQSGAATVSITVTPVDEPVTNGPPTDIALSASTVAENLPAGTPVGTFTTSDPDAGDTHAYALVPGDGSADNASFQLDGPVLETAAPFNLEAKASYTVRVRTIENGADALTHEEQFTITVTNVNETPTDLALSSTAMPENQPPGAAVAGLSTTDPDGAGTFTYSLTGGLTDNAAFTVDGSTLRTAGHVDFEAKASYSIQLRTTDAGGLFHEEPVTITVTNVNEPPIVMGGGGLTEYTEDGSRVVIDPMVTLSDPDSANLTGATVRISSNFQLGDSLFFVNASPIFGEYTEGTLTLSGIASVAAYQEALRTVAFETTEQQPSASRSISFTVNDGNADSNTANRSVSVVDVPE